MSRQTRGGLALAIMFAFLSAKAQTADSLYQRKFTRLSLVVQRAVMTGNKVYNGSDNSIGIGFDRSKSIQFGFHWNFLQTGRFNFKTGIVAKEFAPALNIFLPMSELGMDGGGQYRDNALTFSTGFLFSVPVKAEYFVPLPHHFNIVLGAGLAANFATGDFRQEGLGYAVYDPATNYSRDFFYAVQEQRKTTFCADFSVGAAYASGYGLVQVDVFYSKLFGDAASGRYQFSNLENAPDKSGRFTVSGDYAGISLTLTPKKRFWKKQAYKS